MWGSPGTAPGGEPQVDEPEPSGLFGWWAKLALSPHWGHMLGSSLSNWTTPTSSVSAVSHPMVSVDSADRPGIRTTLRRYASALPMSASIPTIDSVRARDVR